MTADTRNVPIAITANGNVQPHHPLDLTPRGHSDNGRSAVLLVEGVPVKVQVATVARQVTRSLLIGLDDVGWRIPWSDIAEARQGTYLNYMAKERLQAHHARPARSLKARLETIRGARGAYVDDRAHIRRDSPMTIIKHTQEEFEDVREAYELGKTFEGEDIDEIVGAISTPYFLENETAKGNAFEAGCEGKKMPRYANGWRYGDLPEKGQSWDYKDKRILQGVSMVEIEGEDRAIDDVGLVSIAFVALERRPVVRAAGWISIHNGPDGEPLMVEPRVIKENEGTVKRGKTAQQLRGFLATVQGEDRGYLPGS